jgi:hypothetical protein
MKINLLVRGILELDTIETFTIFTKEKVGLG